jgi:hypothetical protein
VCMYHINCMVVNSPSMSLYMLHDVQLLLEDKQDRLKHVRIMTNSV